MPQRAFPTQIVHYLRTAFVRSALTGSEGHGIITDKPGVVAGFLAMFDEVPDELIRLSADDGAALEANIGTIRYGIEQYRNGNSSDRLRKVGPALAQAWALIEKLKDEAPATTHDLSFITDAELQEMIGLDIAAISTNLQAGEWKGATILAGSCCEALLLFGLQAIEAKAPGSLAKAVSAITWPGGKKGPNPADLIDGS